MASLAEGRFWDSGRGEVGIVTSLSVRYRDGRERKQARVSQSLINILVLRELVME